MKKVNYDELIPFYESLSSGNVVMIRKDIDSLPFLRCSADYIEFHESIEPTVDEEDEAWDCSDLFGFGGTVVTISDEDVDDTYYISGLPGWDLGYGDWFPDTCFVPVDYYGNKFNSLLEK